MPPDCTMPRLKLPIFPLSLPQGEPKEVKYALSDEAAAKASGKVNNFDYQEPKSDQQVGGRTEWVRGARRG